MNVKKKETFGCFFLALSVWKYSKIIDSSFPIIIYSRAQCEKTIRFNTKHIDLIISRNFIHKLRIY